MEEKIEIVFAEKTNDFINADKLKETLKQHLEKIEQLLLAYHYAQKERVFNVETGELEFNDDKQTGFFPAYYKTNIFNGCADLDFTEKKEMRILFSIDKSRRVIILTGENIPERYPDEL